MGLLLDKHWGRLWRLKRSYYKLAVGKNLTGLLYLVHHQPLIWVGGQQLTHLTTLLVLGILAQMELVLTIA
jgi:hypothetical protein